MDENKNTEEINEEQNEAEIVNPNKEYEDKIEELEKKNYDLNDKYLRVVAEYDNFRKRSLKERDGIYQEAYIDAVKEILPIVDNMERAEAYMGDDGASEGVKMIMNAIHTALEKMGVTEIETKAFDPNYHNAVMHIDDESYEGGAIVEVFQKGYKLKDKVIRYAMVKVAN
ncbi:MAG: nucleotide exchange factor GrpE [Clostridia bacterium]|nr:nucleotide exchange factor GrpE [Clostridia bacterium]